jgi:hypothetical protein
MPVAATAVIANGILSARGLGLGRVESMVDQSGCMVLFLRPDVASGSGAQLPRCDSAIGAGQLPGREGFGDEGADAPFVGWFGGEKYSHCHGFTVRQGGDIVRRERAGRCVIPVPAQRDRDCAAEGVGAAAGRHRHNRVVSISLADHAADVRRRPRVAALNRYPRCPASSASAAHRRTHRRTVWPIQLPQ